MKNKIMEITGKTRFWAKKNAPELLLGIGLVTGTACIITSSKATLKAKTIKDKLDVELEMILEEQLPDEENKKEFRKAYTAFA